jgi:hypothetical protein
LESFVEKVSDVRRRVTVDGKAAAPGESLEFLAWRPFKGGSPWYVGRGDDKCGGEVVYSIQDIRQLLSVQPEDAKRWLTTSQMGWALTREENEVVNEKDERKGKPVARQLAPMISTFIRAQWESKEMENVDDERRQLLEEAVELDRIWGVWEGSTCIESGLGNHFKVKMT